MNEHHVETGSGPDSRIGRGSPGELEFRLTIGEAELVLEALGAMRYSTVYRLIAKLQNQARGQAQASPEVPLSDPAVGLREVSGDEMARSKAHRA
jgi:hypothetical protein